MPHVYRAQWVLPILAPPIRDGWIAVEAGRITGVGVWPPPGWGQSLEAARVWARTPPAAGVAILPGLVNAHTHLELSWLRGQVPPGEAMPSWASRVIGLRRQAGGDRVAPIAAAIDEIRAHGTALVGDVTNTLAACAPLARSPLAAAVFYELIGFRPERALALVAEAERRLAAEELGDRVRATIVPHAPYSVSPDLFRAIGRAAGHRPLSVHLGESAQEIEFLGKGTGAWRALLESIGAWDDGWVAPACGPVEYLERLGLLNDRLVAVHGVQFDDADLERLAAAAATVVACPRSNAWTGAGQPPIARFYGSGVRVAIGTDSLASVDDLSVFAEMAALRALAPDVPASRILRSATLDGAAALGFGAELGAIAAGRCAELIAVAVPADVPDVEEYLVGGITPDRIQWLTAGAPGGPSNPEP